jgi:hypothetical protein
MRGSEASFVRRVVEGSLACTLGVVSVAGCAPANTDPALSPVEICSKGPFEPQPPEVTPERAAACEQLMRGARVALVVFGDIGKTPEELEQDARAAEEIVRIATDDNIKITLDIVPASQEAEARLDESLFGIFGCVDYATGQPPARIAHETMPELQDRQIVGIGPWIACDWSVGGGYTPDGRHSNVHMGGLDLGLVPAREGEVGSVLAKVIAHEILHQYGLKHHSMLENSKLPEFGGVLDVRALAAGKLVGMNGPDGSIMISDLANKVSLAVKPNPIDMNWLQVLRGRQPYAVEITHDGVTLDAASHAWQYFILQLSEPITFFNYARKDESGDKYLLEFDQLVVVPVLAEGGSGFAGFKLGYACDGETVWHEGEVLRQATSSSSMILQDGGRQIELSIDEINRTISARLLRFTTL